MSHQVKVLFVCLGNICRSPTAQGVFQNLVKKAGLTDVVVVDSAATSDWHIGVSPDQRSVACAKNRGYDLTSLRARQLQAADFAEFDYILAMDESNMTDMSLLCPSDYAGQFELFLHYGSDPYTREVPDPYYSGDDGFELVVDLLEDASDGLLKHIQKNLS